MTTRTRRDQTSQLEDRINILDRNATESTPARQVFRNVGSILTLVRDKMANNKDAVQLSEYCFGVCETLKAQMQVEKVDPFNKPSRVEFDDLERVICDIERTLRRGASTPRMEHDKVKIERHKLEVREILEALNCLSPTPDRNETAFGRLVRREFVPHELLPLVEEFLMSVDADRAIRSLPTDDAQIFIDVIDEALEKPDLPPPARKRCLKLLYRVCGLYALLPKTLKIPNCYNRTGVAIYRGGFADVWRGEHCGQAVAVKVVRTYSNSDLQKILGKFCREVVTWKTLQHPNVLPLIGVTMSESHFAMISGWMPNGNINEFIWDNPDADRLKLLEGVAKGLIYIHEREMIHGDLKGANILIDEAGNARLADFGLLMILSDPANILSSSSYTQGGTARWMSPELIAPQEFGLKTSRPTKHSDCYSLGMVMYETISGNLPFHEDADLVVFLKVVRGERPRREVEFPRGLWKKMKQCWTPHPNDRPDIEDVLRCLEKCKLTEPRDMKPAPTQIPHATDDDDDSRMLEEPSSISSEDEIVITRCICGDDSDTTETMIQCDDCSVWQHVACMGVEIPPDDAEYFCEECRPDLHQNLFKDCEGSS